MQVNGFFAIAVFLGLAFSPPLPQNQAATTLAPARIECYVEVNVYRAVVLWEVVSFGFFLFSTLVAHGFKLYIVLGIFTIFYVNLFSTISRSCWFSLVKNNRTKFDSLLLAYFVLR